MSFDKLLADLQAATTEQDTLAKALPTPQQNDDAAIAAAAAAAAGKKPGEEGDDNDPPGAGATPPAAAAPMAKSLSVTLPDGTTAEAVDGTELIKSLTERLDGTGDVLRKSIGTVLGLVKSQGDMIKSMGEQLHALRNTGAGRKAVVAMPAAVAPQQQAPAGQVLVKSLSGDQLTGEQFMAKAMSAVQSGRLTSVDISIAENCLNKGVAIPAHIVSAATA